MKNFCKTSKKLRESGVIIRNCHCESALGGEAISCSLVETTCEIASSLSLLAMTAMCVLQRSLCTGLRIITLLLAAGCSTPKTDISDVFHYNFSLINPPTGTLSFEDKNVRFAFEPEENDIKILLENRGVYPIKIDWEKATYVDKGGISHRLVTKKVKYEDRDKPQEPTVINPKSSLTEWVMPADNIDRRLLVWKIKPMFPKLKTPEIIDTWDRTTFKVTLPIEINSESKDYEFVFKVKTR